MTLPVLTRTSGLTPFDGVPSMAIKYLSPPELAAIEDAWQKTRDSARKPRQFGRYWLTFLALRFTGARLGEVLLLDDSKDVDFRNAEIRLPTLKQHGKNGKRPSRIVPVPPWVTNEVASWLVQYPDLRGKAFKLQNQNFRAKFKALALSAGISKDLAHPHVMRHTRAIELLRAGVPVTVVQDLLGHSSLTTTAVYLRMSGAEAKSVLRERGML